jgi:PhnB protein
MATKPIPAGYHTATPYLIVNGAAEAIEFYKRVFGATELLRMADPQGRIGHAEIRVGDSVIMLADEHPDLGYRGPRSMGGSSVSILLYVDDVDTIFDRALSAGATVQRPIANQFYGDRSGKLEDPFGHVWSIATHVEDVPPEEIRRRADAAMRSSATSDALIKAPSSGAE